MNLKELNESYDEYVLTEEYLIEGLKIFKKSKRLYNYANKIDKRLIKLNDKNNKTEEIAFNKKLSSDIKKMADEYKAVEDAFADNTLSKDIAKSKIKKLKIQHDVLLKYAKSKQTKAMLGKIGLGLLAGGLIAALGSVAIPAGLIQSVAASAAAGGGSLAGSLAQSAGAMGSNLAGTVGRVATGVASGVASGVRSTMNKLK